MKIEGVRLIQGVTNTDERGSFTKHVSGIEDLNFKLRESFVSKSFKGVVRGMHLQLGPMSGWKLVTVLSGEIFDVLVDLRPKSSTYLATETFSLDENTGRSILVPEGVAHGFQAQTDVAMLYQTEYSYSPDHDTGVNPLSLNINWPLEISFMSIRDRELPSLANWNIVN